MCLRAISNKVYILGHSCVCDVRLVYATIRAREDVPHERRHLEWISEVNDEVVIHGMDHDGLVGAVQNARIISILEPSALETTAVATHNSATTWDYHGY